MPRLSISLSQERYDKIENMVDNGVVKSKSKAVNKLISRGETAEDLAEQIQQLEDEKAALENRLEESRQREIARDKTKQEIDVLREELQEQQNSQDAPFFVRWYRWYSNR